jgi:hypothetical protein
MSFWTAHFCLSNNGNLEDITLINRDKSVDVLKILANLGENVIGLNITSAENGYQSIETIMSDMKRKKKKMKSLLNFDLFLKIF